MVEGTAGPELPYMASAKLGGLSAGPPWRNCFWRPGQKAVAIAGASTAPEHQAPKRPPLAGRRPASARSWNKLPLATFDGAIECLAMSAGGSAPR
jgi:hypothetical protein